MAILRNMPLGEYLASSNISHSKLRDFATGGPRLYHDRYLAKTLPREETAALSFGTAFEILFQQGGAAFKEQVVITMPGDGRNKAVKAARDAAKATGRICIGQDEYEDMLEMVSSLHELDVAQRMLVACESQVTLTGEQHGLTLQSRPDYVMMSDLRCYAIDLKTTKNLSDFDTEWGVRRLSYHTQAAMARRLLALHGYAHAECYLMVVEKIAPYRSRLIQLDGEGILQDGETWLDTHAPRLSECIRRNHFPRAEPDVVVLGARRPRHEPMTTPTTEIDHAE